MPSDDHLLGELSRVGRDVVRAGLVVGSGGNLSARLPGAASFRVTAAGTWLDRLDDGAFAEVRIEDGATVPRGVPARAAPARSVPARGVPPRGVAARAVPARGASAPVRAEEAGNAPTSELALHLATYRLRPDVNAIIHLHPQLAILLDAMGERIRLVTTDHAFYVRRIARTPFHAPGTAELAEVAAEAVADGTNCVILAHHGCSVLGETVEMAHRRALNLEEAARLTYRALMLSGGVPGREVDECPYDFATTDTV